MELFKTLFGCDDPDTLGVTSHLVVTYHDQYKYHEAACLATDLLSRQQRILGSSSSEALDTQQTLATIFSGQRKFKEAAEMRRSVLYERRNATDVNRLPNLAQALVGYSQSLKDSGRANEALGLLEEALKIYESSVELDTMNFLHCKAKIAQLYHIQGRTGDAIKTGRETLESRRQLLGETHPYTIVSMSDQATFLAQASRLTESENEIGCAVKLAKEHLGEDNHNTISIANNAADLYRDMGLTDTAEEMSSLSFHGARRLMGIDHPDTLSAMFLHSKILFQQGQHLAAMEGMRLCILRSRRKHGEHHFLTSYREEELAAVEKIYKDCRLLTPLDNAPASSR